MFFFFFFFFSSRRRHTRFSRDWSSDVCSSDLHVVADVGDDVVHLDWDTAVSLEDLHEFADWARVTPGRPLVAPMLEYPGGMHGTVKRALASPTWNVRRYVGASMRVCMVGERVCQLFGFGMVYLPAALVAENVAALGEGEPFTD